MIEMKRALISVWDKTGLDRLVQLLHDRGCTLVSTGGTAKFIEGLGLPCERIETVTGFPEILGGRVKTLHPKVFGGILTRGTKADAQELAEHGVDAFQLVCVNLYPFTDELQKSGGTDLDHMLEYIDIGGVSLIRAAAKNHARCVVATSPDDYSLLTEQLDAHGAVDQEVSGRLAAHAFQRTAVYDDAIGNYLAKRYLDSVAAPASLQLTLDKEADLSYGENPHQSAALYKGDAPHLPLTQLSGKPLSYNNYIDLDGCLGTVGDLRDRTACVIVKHSNPCGIGLADGDDLLQAYERALACDSQSAFGGIVGFSKPIDEQTAKKMREMFFEVIAAPAFSDAALALLQKKKKLRLLTYEWTQPAGSLAHSLKQTLFGFLRQEVDTTSLSLADATVAAERVPTEEEKQALTLAWCACKWAKSNAIVVATATQTVGIGAGQMSRVDAVRIAIEKAAKGNASAVLASDAFFSFS